jgi:hypothetical protein
MRTNRIRPSSLVIDPEATACWPALSFAAVSSGIGGASGLSLVKSER